MLRDLSITQPLYERIDATALLKWHIDPEDPDDPAEEAMANEVKRIVEQTPNFLGYRRALLLGTFHGRYAVSNTFNWDFYKKRPYLRVAGWEPIHGDKLCFSLGNSDSNVGLRIGYHDAGLDNMLDQIEMTPEGRVLWLDRYQRQFYVIFKHMIRDGVYEDVRTLGSIHGVGIRSDVYWHWVLKNQVLSWAMNHWERYGSGFDVWWYSEGDPDSQAMAQAAAQAQSQGFAIMLPRPRNQVEQTLGVEHIEVPGTGLADMLKVLENYFDGRLRTFIVGQSLSSGTASTGLGSGVADLHAETKDNLVRADSINLQETLTEQLVQPLVNYNREQYPEWPDCKLKFVFEFDETNVKEQLDAAKALHQIGVGVDADNLREVAGKAAARPNVLVYGIGHSGTTILTQMLGALGWQLGDADEEFAESVSIRAMNQKLLRTGKAVRDELFNRLRALPEPWAVKDPRFHRTLEHWLPAFAELENLPLLLWIRRDAEATIGSYLRRGDSYCDSKQKFDAAYAKAERGYQLWPWEKVSLDYEQVMAAVSLFRPTAPSLPDGLRRWPAA
jgi:hypothetical protein